MNRELISFCTGIGFYEPFRQPPPSSAKNSQNFIAELRAVALNLAAERNRIKGRFSLFRQSLRRVLRPGAVKLALQL